jgi:hypothetical protein
MSDTAMRAAILSRLGPFPERAPLALELGAPEDLGDHTRVLVSYAVEPGVRAPAWLLRPKGDSPPGGWPAVLAIHQHAGNYELGKSEPAGLSADASYHYGLDLCRRGYVALCPDQLCFEDRRAPELRVHQPAARRRLPADEVSPRPRGRAGCAGVASGRRSR